MSVIPFIIDEPHPTVVQTQEAFHVARNAVLIVNLDLEQLTDKNVSNVSYDFRVGNRYRSHRENTPRQIPDGGTITLRPGSALIIETKEFVHLPQGMFGIIAPKVSLLQLGLSTTFSKVDPGYPGHLLITLFNLGQTTQILQKGQSFCAFTLFDVGAGVRIYQQGPKQLHARIGQSWRDSIREWLEANHVLVMVLLIIATSVLIVVTFLLAAVHLITFALSQHP